MTAARAFLLKALQRVIDGGDVGEVELETAVPDPFALDCAERNAWEELSHWVDDDDIRGRDKRYAASNRERMRDRLVALTTDGSQRLVADEEPPVAHCDSGRIMNQ